MNQNLLGSWADILPPSSIECAERLYEKARHMRELRMEQITFGAAPGHDIYPAQDKIFRALTLTPPEKTRVVIVGQDPYINPGQADGLAFSCTKTPLPPSLKNIFKELTEDIGCPMPASGDLTPWAERGVLLLNTTLTVFEGMSNSHGGWGWMDFTHDVIKAALTLPQPIVFILWGGKARAFVADLLISSRSKDKKGCLWSSHPSPLGATKGGDGVPAFKGSRPFSNANAMLTQMGGEPVDWVLP